MGVEPRDQRGGRGEGGGGVGRRRRRGQKQCRRWVTQTRVVMADREGAQEWERSWGGERPVPGCQAKGTSE